MNPVLATLLQNPGFNTRQIAELLGMKPEAVEAEYDKLRAEGVLLGWRPVVNPDYAPASQVRAVIELKISPERDGGFDRLANRISQFEQVESCYLMSGAYDLLVVVRAENLHQVAAFVFERLATLEGVVSTSTHFMLRAYKEQGFMMGSDLSFSDRPMVSA